MEIEYKEPELKHYPKKYYEIFTFRTTAWMEEWLNFHVNLIDDFKMSITDECILLVIKWKTVRYG